MKETMYNFCIQLNRTNDNDAFDELNEILLHITDKLELNQQPMEQYLSQNLKLKTHINNLSKQKLTFPFNIRWTIRH